MQNDGRIEEKTREEKIQIKIKIEKQEKLRRKIKEIWRQEVEREKERGNKIKRIEKKHEIDLEYE